MRFKFLFFVTLATLSTLFVGPMPAEAKPARVAWNGKYVEVVESLPSSWDVAGAAADIDWYTGSAIKIVSKCSGKVNCATIKSGSVKGSPVGWTSCGNRYIGWGSKTALRYCTITIDINDAAKNKKYNYSTRRWLVRHELGHWFSLSHRSVCDTTMFEYVRCHNGSLPPNAFTSSERTKLRSR